MGAGGTGVQPPISGVMTGSNPNNPGNLQAQTMRNLGFTGALPSGTPTMNPQQPSGLSRFATNAGKFSNALQQGFGGNPFALGQQQQQPRMPVNFQMPNMPYIPPPQVNNPFYGG